MSEPKLSDILHILRNPHGWSQQAIRAAQLKACDLLESTAAPVPAREWVPEAIAALRTHACSMHVGKCYLCETMWSEGAPDAHTEQCLISRMKAALPPPPAADK